MASLFTLLVAAAVMAGTYGCILETIEANTEKSMNISQATLDVVSRLEPKVDDIDNKLLDIDFRTKIIATIEAIDQSKYHVSQHYKGRVYLASKQEAAFNIADSDKACASEGGYLLELEDNAERDFTLEFAKKVGGSKAFAMGGNDIELEGQWVYYHSKTPVPSSVTWLPGEPNNSGQNEDCMTFRMSKDGLNDVPCNTPVKFLCEVPLRY